MRSAYSALLRLYPAPYREVFGGEMAAVFDEARAERRSHGLTDYMAFLVAELAGLLTGAFSTWGAEFVERSRQKLLISYWFSIAAGVVVTTFFQGFFCRDIGRICGRCSSGAELPPVVPDNVVPLLVAGGVLVLLSVFSLAFVWNMRIIGNRAGRMNPIWMPSTRVGDEGKRRMGRLARSGRAKQPRSLYGLEK